MDKKTYFIEELAKMGPVGRTSLFGAIREGNLIAQKAGRRTFVTMENYEAFLKTFPMVKGGNTVAGE